MRQFLRPVELTPPWYEGTQRLALEVDTEIGTTLKWRDPKTGTREDLYPDHWVLGARVLLWNYHHGTEDLVLVLDEGGLEVDTLLNISHHHKIGSSMATLLLSSEALIAP